MALFQVELFSPLLAAIDYNLCNCAETRLIKLRNIGKGATEEGKQTVTALQSKVEIFGPISLMEAF